MTVDSTQPDAGAATVTGMLEALGIPVSTIASRGLALQAEPAELVVAERGADGRDHRLVPEAAAAWRRMKDAAAADGVVIMIVSAFRPYSRQFEIIERKLAQGQPLDRILQVSAPPGYSEHHNGRAVDVGTEGAMDLERSFAGTPAHGWLVQHADGYGFYMSYPPGNPWGYAHEPWHWCYRLDTMGR